VALGVVVLTLGVGLAVVVLVVGLERGLALAAGLWQTTGPPLVVELGQSAGAAARWVRVGGAVQLAAVAGG
jgi:hypothetical protein